MKNSHIDQKSFHFCTTPFLSTKSVYTVNIKSEHLRNVRLLNHLCLGNVQAKIFRQDWFACIFHLKVMKSQNEYMKSSHCPKYERNIREISALEDCIDYLGILVWVKYILYIFTQSNIFKYLVYIIFQGRNLSNILFVFWAMRRLHIFILTFHDLYKAEKNIKKIFKK